MLRSFVILAMLGVAAEPKETLAPRDTFSSEGRGEVPR